MSQTLKKSFSRLVLSHGGGCRLQAVGYRNSLSPISYLLSAARGCRLQAIGYRNSLSPISYLLSPARLGLVAAAVLAMSGAAQAQTSPTAQNLPFSVNFGSASFTSLPAGVAVWNGLNGGSVSSQALAEASAPTGNATLTAATAAQTSGGAYGYVAGGDGKLYIQTSSNASNGVCQPVVAIVTTGASNITLSYTVDVVSAQPRTIGVVAQYRVGTSGAWTTLSASSGSNPFSQAGGTAGLKTTVSASLPSAANNQAVVQVRWAIWRGTETGNSSGIAIDNISLTAAGGGTGPTISGFSPSSGAVGSSVTISGSNFSSPIVS